MRSVGARPISADRVESRQPIFTRESLADIERTEIEAAKDVSKLCFLFTSREALGITIGTTTVSSNLRSKICTANPKSFVDWYG